MSHPVALLAIADPSLRQRLGQTLTSLRWCVVETAGGAEALAHLEKAGSEAVILDRWLPDLDVSEFFREVESCYPEVDLISVDGSLQSTTAPRSVRHGELMHAIRVSQEWDGAAHLSAPDFVSERGAITRVQPDGLRSAKFLLREEARHGRGGYSERGNEEISRAGYPGSAIAQREPGSEGVAGGRAINESINGNPSRAMSVDPRVRTGSAGSALPELLGDHPCMLEVSRRIRLVAPRTTPVLIQGPSGTGKELVARAIHRLSPRAHRPFVVLNCAAIPESLLEAELFGHTRGAFTGAVQGRVGRIESANGGTLFLDEIGEMPLALQSKLLRFLEAGEIQKVGDNDSLTVDVRVLAATHQPLAQRVKQGAFREDVFYRLAVFLIKTPSLREHAGDIPMFAATFLRRLCDTSPMKRLDAAALGRLLVHTWPGNVRELAHVMERAYILAESRTSIVADDIEFENFE
jgi:DNA-binding NtrC family response regulator